VIRLAKLALWALQDNRVASAWRPCDNHVCGAVAISAGKKKTRKKQKIGRNHDTYHCWDPEKNTFVKLHNVVFATIRPSIEIILPPPESMSKGERNEGSSHASDGQEAVADQMKSTKLADASTRKSENSKEVSRDKPAKLEVPSDAQIALTQVRSAQLANKPLVDYVKLSNPQAKSARQLKVSLEEHSDSCTNEIDDLSMSDVIKKAYLVANISDNDPKTYKEALGRPEAAQW
jgi:hypothetical protein